MTTGLDHLFRFKIATIHEDAVIPKRATPGSAGMDVCACEDNEILSGEWKAISTGLVVQVPNDCYVRVAPRSGLAYKHGIDTFAGVIDSDYTDECKVILMNHGKTSFIIKKGDRIAQFIFEKIHDKADFCPVSINDIKKTNRHGGFGSTGV